MHSTTLIRTDVLALKDALYEQWRTGQLSTHEYTIAFAAADSAHSHDQLCANGDRRIAIVVIDQQPLCGVCALKTHEARA